MTGLVTGLLPEGAEILAPAALILVGIIGIIVPVLPGLFITLLGVLLWSWETGTTLSWTIFAVCAVWFVAGLTGQYLIPGKRLKSDGVTTKALLLAALTGIVGMFVIPIVGFFVGFVLGLYVQAWLPRRDSTAAWSRTKVALTAILTSIGIELIAAILIALTWVVGLVLS